MKKILLLPLLLLVSIVTWAAHFTVVSPYDTQGGELTATVAVAEFVTNESNASYEVAAFVGDECRAVAVPESVQGKWRVTLRVPSADTDADNGKAITFKAYNTVTTCEYDLTSSPAVTFTGDNTVNITLTLTAVTGLTLSDISMNVDESIDLTSKLTVEPTGASLPLNMTPTWRLSPSDVATITGNTLKATQPVTDGTYSVSIGRLSARAKIEIFQPATGIVINPPTEITYRIGEDEAALNELLAVTERNTHYTVTPSNTTDQVSWEIGDQTIIGMSAAGGAYALLKPGTTTVTPIVTKRDGTVLRPSNPSAITITVEQPVKTIQFNWTSQNPNKANVGDDVYSRLAALVTVLPEQATNKDFTFKVTPLSSGSTPAGTYTQTDNSLVFNNEGYYEVQVVSADNANLDGAKAHIKFQVENPAKQVNFTKSELEIMLDESNQEFAATVSTMVNRNISLGPDGWSIASGTIAVTGNALTIDQQETKVSNDGAKVSVTGAAEGTSTVTVTLQWNDYSNYDGTNASIGTAQATPQSFTVKIVSKLSGFTAYNTLNADGTGTLRLEPIPVGAQYDADAILVTLANSIYPDDWTAVSISNRTNGTDGITLTYTAALPGKVSVTAKETGAAGYTIYDGNSTGSQPAVFDGFQVPATYSFASGWQWRSNSYGDESSYADEFFNSTFTASFGEARTQTALLINDDLWGLFSDGTFGISQRQCYKIRMKAAASTTLTYGTFPQEGQSVSLYKGWTWVGSPYVYNRSLTSAFQGVSVPQGTRIVSKNSGFAEWNGTSWTGSLKTIEKNQGYIVYCPEQGASLPFRSEYTMSQGNDAAGARTVSQSVWSYDDSQFAGNMTMIALLNDVDNPDDYTVGAFVGEECRGEGVVVDGRLFITAHANSGEQVSFRLHNELTGEFFDVAETVSCQQMLGTLARPFQMSITDVTTGISEMTGLRGQHAVETYDLMGRKNPNSRLTIIRTADGKVVKRVKN